MRFSIASRGTSARATDIEGAATEKPTRALGPEELASLPAELRKELLGALISLDIERIQNIIGRISKQNAELGAKLSQYADSYAYSAILHALESSEPVT